MATIWVSTSGTDTASGTNLGLAVKTIADALPKAGQGGTINMVNDGNHPGRGTGLFINITYNGTNFTSDPGLIIRGVDAAGAPAICTIAMTATGQKYLDIDDASDYVWVEGLQFDYSGVLGTGTTNMWPITINAQAQNVRLNDIEVVLSPTIGSAVSLATHTELPRFPYVGSAGTASAGQIEFYNNILSNARMYVYNPANAQHNIHNNIFIHDAAAFPSSTTPIAWTGGSADELRRFYHNTIVVIHYADDNMQPVIDMNQNNTTNLAFHSNLIFIETGAAVSAPSSNYLLDGAAAATQTTTVITCSNNYVALGAILAAEATAWDTSSATGLYGLQLNSTWRAGGAEAGTALNSSDVLNRTASLTSIFNDYTASYTWTPGDYSHDLPADLRPLVGRTTALGGGVVGAIDDAVNTAPVCAPFTMTATSGVVKTVNTTDGLAAYTTDAEGDTIAWDVSLPASHGTVVLNTTYGNFTYTPVITYVGTDTFRYDAHDGTTFSLNEAIVTINVNNHTPVGTSRSYTTPEETLLVVNATNGLLAGASDADPGHTLSVTSVVAPATGTLVSYNITTGSFVYRPGSFASGFDSFTFKITDGGLLSAVATATVYVTPVTNPVTVDIVDTAPFFRPSLYVETEFRARWKENRKKTLNEANYTDDRKWNESTSRTIILTPAATTTVTLGGIASAQYLILETDYPVEVSIDGTDKYWPVTKVLAVALTEFSSVVLKSVSTTNAQVILIVVD